MKNRWLFLLIPVISAIVSSVLTTVIATLLR